MPHSTYFYSCFSTFPILFILNPISIDIAVKLNPNKILIFFLPLGYLSLTLYLMLESTSYRISLLLLNERPLFPGGVTTLVIAREEEIHLIEQLAKTNVPFGVVLLKDPAGQTVPVNEVGGLNNLCSVGTLCKVNRYVRLPNGTLHVFVSTQSTFNILNVEKNGEIIEAEVVNRVEEEINPRFVAPYMRLLRRVLSELLPQSPIFAFATDVNLANIKDATTLLNYVCSSIKAPKEFLQEILETDTIKEKYEILLGYLENEKSIIIMQNQIRNELYDNARKKNQEYVIKQQIAALESQLEQINGKGSGDPARPGFNYTRLTPRESDLKELQGRYEKMKKILPKEYHEVIEKELDKLSMGEQSSPDYTISRTYLDTIFSLPYPKKNFKPKYNVEKVREVLDRDHYGMKDVKDRILEFLASRSLAGDPNGAIICLVGPPGVGKTSIGKSIAEALGRKYFRFSVGGMRDEAEIKGHRRTYVGALPGKIIRGMLEVKEVDPLFLIDEIDKIGMDYKGDPASALLEVLDPEQNSHFRDLYLDIPYDLSKILFIVTANDIDTIPQPLLDRMEVIEVPGYTPQEKLNIAKKYLFPRLIRKNGLEKHNITADDDALLSIAEEYSREAGVRNYEKNLDKVLRKVSLKVVEKTSNEEDFHLDRESVERYLGQPRFDLSTKVEANVPGTAVGLAWTSLGGDVLLIEAEAVPGHEDFKLTGKLGDVMKESCAIALSVVKRECYLRGMDPGWFKKNSIHLHVPEGATPKDGPSAGITMATALWSMVTGSVIKSDLAMTGELTLTGLVMPIGGLREKVLAARRNHVREIIIPEKNRKDLDELDSEVKGDVVFHPVSRIEEVLKIAFPCDNTVRLSAEEAERVYNGYLEKEKNEEKKDAN